MSKDRFFEGLPKAANRHRITSFGEPVTLTAINLRASLVEQVMARENGMQPEVQAPKSQNGKVK